MTAPADCGAAEGRKLPLSWEVARQVFVTRKQAHNLVHAEALLAERLGGAGPLAGVLAGAVVRISSAKVVKSYQLRQVDAVRPAAGDGDWELSLRGVPGRVTLGNLSNREPEEREQKQAEAELAVSEAELVEVKARLATAEHIFRFYTTRPAGAGRQTARLLAEQLALEPHMVQLHAAIHSSVAQECAAWAATWVAAPQGGSPASPGTAPALAAEESAASEQTSRATAPVQGIAPFRQPLQTPPVQSQKRKHGEC